MKLKDSFFDEQINCLVMDLMADDVRKIVNESGGPVAEEVCKYIFKQMVEAVANCHRNNIVHRDIKMENFLVAINKETHDLTVKLTDFGLSKKIKPGKKISGCVGTYYTMAPEIIKKEWYN